MNKIKALLILAIMLLVSGCGTKVPFKAQEPLDGAALLYVYVVDKVTVDDTMQDSLYKIQINGKNVVGSIEAGEYKVFDMKPATVLVTSLRRNIEKMHQKVTMQAGNSYFLKIESGSFGEAYSFDKVSESEGQNGVAKTTLSGATGIDVTQYTPDFGGSTAGEDSKTVAVPAMTEAEIDAIIERKIAERVSKMNIPAPVAVPVAAPVASPVPSYSTPAKSSTMDEIQRAYEMKEQGILTQEEFSKIKAEILAK